MFKHGSQRQINQYVNNLSLFIGKPLMMTKDKIVINNIKMNFNEAIKELLILVNNPIE